MKKHGIFIEDYLYEKIKKEAQERGMTIGGVVDSMVFEFFDRKEHRGRGRKK